MAEGQAIKGVTIGMDPLSAVARNKYLQLLMVQSEVEGQQQLQGQNIQELLTRMEALTLEAGVAIHGQETAISHELRRGDQRQEGIHEEIRDHLTTQNHDTQKQKGEHQETRKVIQSYIPKEIKTLVETAVNGKIEEFLWSRPNWNPSTRAPSEEGTQNPYRLN